MIETFTEESVARRLGPTFGAKLGEGSATCNPGLIKFKRSMDR